MMPLKGESETGDITECEKRQCEMARHLKFMHTDEEEDNFATCLPTTTFKMLQFTENAQDYQDKTSQVILTGDTYTSTPVIDKVSHGP